MAEPNAIIDKLKHVLDDHENLAEQLERSLVKAFESAQKGLKPELFDALEWPRNLDQYEAYLKRFIRWVPRQSADEAWQGVAPDERYAKEVTDRTAHFFFLVDQDVDGGAPQDCAALRDWMTEFARQWGSFLDTTESFSPEILRSFIEDAPEYRVEESMVDGRPNAPSGWLTFNQFFGRELNGGLRPIAEPGNNLVVTSPADCVFQHAYDVDAESNIPATTVKGTHKYGNVKQLLEGSEYCESFARGTFVHYMLQSSSYHRYHLPVSGQVKECFRISGTVYMKVEIEDREFKASDSATTGFEFSQNRGIVTIDTSACDAGDLGIVAVVPVGMSHVSSVTLTAVQGKQMAKGEEFGYFQFGGSDIIVLFQPGVQPQIDSSTDYRLFGTPIARCARR